MQNHKPISQAIKDSLASAQDILFIAHRKPDGDTLGSNLGFAHYLQSIGKNTTVFCIDPVPQDLLFLPKSHQITSDHTVFAEKYDLVFVLDCATLELAMVQDLVKALPGQPTMINIDHHVSNPRFGNINLVIDDASSTAEVIYRLLTDWRIEWNADIATCLACGMITDTGGFKNPATNYKVLSAASELIRHGANIYQIVTRALTKTDPKRLRLVGRALERLTLVDRYNLVYTFLLNKDFEECGLTQGDSEGISNLLHILNEGKVILVLQENGPDMVRGSLRTTSEIDLSKLASIFGGGGHKKSAGFSLPGKLVYDNNTLKII